MARVLVVYHSVSGHTAALAERIADELRRQGIDVACKEVADTDPADMLDVDGVIVGSPTYYGTMAAEVKSFLDRSVAYHTRLDGKVGAAFSTAGSTGQETTVLSILQALLIHGMIVQGDCSGLHYGVTSVGGPHDEDARNCERLARRFAEMIAKVRHS